MINRRRLLTGLSAGAGSLALPTRASIPPSAKVVVVGGGFAGASCARALRQIAPNLQVILVEPKSTYAACPFSNLVIAGHRQLSQQQFSYGALQNTGIDVLQQSVTEVAGDQQTVRLADGSMLHYDRLVMAPGIDIKWGAIKGYDQAAAEHLPHAWQAGPQTQLLRDQLTHMRDGGTVVIAVPQSPYRCPPGPYERASLIASYLKKAKPRSKLLILDAKDNFSKKPLFMQGWRGLYGDMIEWRGASDGASVIAVDKKNKRLQTDFDEYHADVANVIPPQHAGAIARRAGLTDASGWCPIKPSTFESTQQDNIHVIGDAAIANAMPKSAFAANAQAKFCAVQIARLLRGEAPTATTLINTCYSLLDPDYGISVAGVYRPSADSWRSVPGAGGTSPLDTAMAVRQQEARYARDWFATLTRQVFG